MTAVFEKIAKSYSVDLAKCLVGLDDVQANIAPTLFVMDEGEFKSCAIMFPDVMAMSLLPVFGSPPVEYENVNLYSFFIPHESMYAFVLDGETYVVRVYVRRKFFVEVTYVIAHVPDNEFTHQRWRDFTNKTKASADFAAEFASVDQRAAGARKVTGGDFLRLVRDTAVQRYLVHTFKQEQKVDYPNTALEAQSTRFEQRAEEVLRVT